MRARLLYVRINQLTKFYLGIMISVILGSMILSCGGGGSSAAAGNTPVTNQYAITIAGSGTVPILGSSPTSTVVYIHNNTPFTVSGITYSSQTNSTASSSSRSSSAFFAKILSFLGLTSKPAVFINAASATMCSSISAWQSCPLTFTTPTPNTLAFQGSAIITAPYTLDGQSHSFSQLINYAQVINNQESGVLFSSSIEMIAYPGIKPYGTIYAYGSGSGQLYTVNSLVSNTAGVSVVQGNIQGQQVPSNFVQAIELGGPILSSGGGISAQVTLSSIDTSLNTFSSSSVVGIQTLASTDEAILVAGLAPVVNVASTTTGTLPIVNAGNESATSISITYGTGLSSSSSTCGSSLAAQANCTITFSVTSESSGGSANITVSYTSTGGGSTSVIQTVVWYNNGSALVAMGASPTLFSYYATYSEYATITVTNLTTRTLSGITVDTPSIVSSSGYTTISESSVGNTCDGSSLAYGASCSYIINSASTYTDSGYILIPFSASYYDSSGTAESYSRVMLMQFTANSYAPALSVSASNMSIIGNNLDSTYESVTITNSGPATATISSAALVSPPSYLVSSGSCGTIAYNASCTGYVLTLGPTTQATAISATTESFTIAYYGGMITSGNDLTATGTFTIAVSANDQSVTMESVVVTNSNTSLSGNGATSDFPIIFNGYTTSTQYVTFTYENTGTNSIKLTGVSNSNSAYNWLIDTSSSTCYNSGSLPSASIAVGGTCTIVFTNVLYTNMLGQLGSTIGSSYAMNLTVPTLTFYDTNTTNQFSSQTVMPVEESSGTVLYVTSYQATLASTLTQASGTAGDVTVTNTLANATGYANITVTTNMEDYFSGTPTVSNCTQNNTTYSGIRTQVCTLGPSALIGSGVYTLGSTSYVGYTLDAIYSLSTASQLVSVSQLYNILTLN